MCRIEEKMISMGYSLPSPPKVAGSYVPFVCVHSVLYLSGTLPITEEKSYQGKVGDTQTVENGQDASRLCLLNALSNAKVALGSLEAICRIIFLDGFVNAVSGFSESPAVLNGASDLLTDIFGEDGKHARAAIAVSGLPLDATVELKLTIQTKG